LNDLYAGSGRTDLQLADHRLDDALHAFDLGFDPAVIKVSHSTHQPASRGRVTSECTIAYPLYMTDDEELRTDTFV
jgi:hypothetical protein